MTNSNIFKIVILLLFISCKSQQIENRYDDNQDGINYLTKDFQYFKTGQKSGIYTYPKLNFRYSLKKGKLDGEMSLIKHKDTLYFCCYDKNKPIGKYINKLYLEKYTTYRLIMTMNPAIIIDGEGVFNANHEKEGFWQQFDGICSKKGNYIKGMKNGLWEEDCFNDGGAYQSKKDVMYKNDSIVGLIEN